VAADQNTQPDRGPANAAEALERLGRLSLRELSMDSLLQTVAHLSRTVMPGNPETSVLLLVKDKPTTVVHTGQLAVDLDETQYERGHGPCLHAARTGELTEIPDTRTESRWRDYVTRAAERGNLYAYQSAREMAANLQTALESRAVIDQAKGVLMERYRLTADQAFQLLARTSMSANRKVRDIAEHLVRTGEFPLR
jgi:ANTAR domain